MNGFLDEFWHFVRSDRRRTARVFAGTPLVLAAMWLFAVHSVVLDPVTAKGQVTGTDCRGKAQTFTYRFEVMGSAYVGEGPARMLEDACADTAAGAPVDVTYYRGYPSISIGGSMRTWWHELLGLIVLGPTLLAPFFLLIMFGRHRWAPPPG